MPMYDEQLSRLVREINALGEGETLPPVERDEGGELRATHLLGRAMETGASDLLLVEGVPATARVDGRLVAIDPQRLDGEVTRRLVHELLDERAQRVLERRRAVDHCFECPGLGRFRCNAHYQRGRLAAAVRVLPQEIPDLASLGLPPTLERFAALTGGLVILAGPTGCGKSTTLASLVDIVNRTRNVHVVTVEEPVEFLHTHRTAIVEQMEVGRDTPSFAEALRHILRQDPDVILVGEMRDLETISLALTAAETGHLVLSTLHTGDVAQTMDRIVDVFPEKQQPQVRSQLALSLAGVVVQHLLPRQRGRGRVPAVEVLFVNGAVRNLIRRGLNHQIPAQMSMARAVGNVTLEDSLAALVRRGEISRREALLRTRHPDELKTLLC